MLAVVRWRGSKTKRRFRLNLPQLLVARFRIAEKSKIFTLSY